jgi:hypothetical protein
VSAQVDAAVRSLEASRAALAAAFAAKPASIFRRRDGFAGTREPLSGIWEALRSSVVDAAGEHGLHDLPGGIRASLETARPALEDAVRSQPWTAVAVAGLCGAVAVWIVSTRRRLVFSAARLWWRTAGVAILTSAAFKFYQRYTAASPRPAPPADKDAAETVTES